MSSKRGRKRNDNLPPNRARDVQRAFRARRAAHLQALEHRVAELEEENNVLRATLGMPLANRPALGRGPTGKDKPKGPSSQSSNMSTSLPPISALSSGGPLPSTSRDSPSDSSSRTHSLSPSAYSAALSQSPHSVPGLEGNNWDEFLGKDQSEASASSAAYPLQLPVSTSGSQAPCYASSATSNTRSTLEQLYFQSLTQNYSPTSDRPMGGGQSMGADGFTSNPFTLREERRPFSFPQPSLSSHAGLSNQSSSLSLQTAVNPQGGNPGIQSPVSPDSSAVTG
ncbi:hypothetical protein OBBRIDRAFT_831026 [Obba rivulosa]|uniref:BZIP domain-containing protein n=1 Tax=Obba rivulosa TaxID=1052685 RepID=A0A8E2J671_9APHY|nr:hypothetical protein OBBRIDRAFT_831026 [Obba rivulosa]